jgi:hypothetical protein
VVGSVAPVGRLSSSAIRAMGVLVTACSAVSFAAPPLARASDPAPASDTDNATPPPLAPLVPPRGRGPEVVHEGAWRAIALDAVRVGSVEVEAGGRTPALGAGATVGAAEPARFRPLWTPADVATWSGPGLRGARVTTVDAEADALWIGTAGGGLAVWDGAAWRHADRRTLRDDTVVGVVVTGAGAWVATPRQVSLGARVWSAEMLGGEVRDLAATPDDASVWVLAGARAHRLPDGAVAGPWTSEALGLVEAEDGARVALEAGATVPLPGGAGPTWPAAAHAAVARVDGAWLATEAGLLAWTPAGVVDSRLTDRAIHAVLQRNTRLVAAGPWGIARVDPDGEQPFVAAYGLPDGPVTALCPGPRPDQLWVGTAAGAYLVRDDGAARPLPLAPLPAGVAVHDLVETRDGIAVASDRGLVWVGDREPVGFADLAAAVGAPAAAVSRAADGSWWALGPLGPVSRGPRRNDALTRWDPGSLATDVRAVGPGVAVLTAWGARAWLPGAEVLAPATGPGGVRARSGPDGWLWVLDGAGRLSAARPGARADGLLDDVHDLAPVAGGAWALAGRAEVDAVRVDADGVTARRNLPADFVGHGAIGAATLLGGERVLAVDDAGALWRIGERVEPLGVSIEGAVSRVLVDADGAWLLTDVGLWRIALPRVGSARGR